MDASNVTRVVKEPADWALVFWKMLEQTPKQKGDPECTEEEFGLLFKMWRISKGMSRKACAEAYGIDVDRLLFIETGTFRFKHGHATAGPQSRTN